VPELGDPLFGPEAEIVAAMAALLAPALFIAIVVLAVRRRGPMGTISPRLENAVAGSGGLVLGTMVPFGGDVTVLGPIAAVSVLLVVGLVRRGRLRQAGWLLTALALPSTALWAYGVLRQARGVPDFDSTGGWLVVGLAAMALGLWLVMRGDPGPPPPDIHAPAGRPGSRSFAIIAETIRAAARVGPFGIPELSMLVASIGAWLIVPFLIPATTPTTLRLGIPILLVAAIGTEVYVRAWPATSRRAFEALSWLGAQQRSRARYVTGEDVPTTRARAIAWLDRRPLRAEELAIRIDTLLFVGRIDEARRLLSELPTSTPAERFWAASLAEFVDWQAGGDGDLAGMEAAVTAILPVGGDDRLRADVAIATARVRHRIEAGLLPGAALEPLLEVRERLGRRADGQIGRALRRRVFLSIVVTLTVLAGASELLSGPSRLFP
jgi:hypothetical protein